MKVKQLRESIRSIIKQELNESDLKDKLSPKGKESFKNLFGTKDTNPEFKKGYTKGYRDGYLDGKTNSPFNDEYDWKKYSK
jgi:hypothetical protein